MVVVTKIQETARVPETSPLFSGKVQRARALTPDCKSASSLHIPPPPCYYPGFPSPPPTSPATFPLPGTTSLPHLRRTLRFHFPPRLTVHAGCFSPTTSQFPGIGSRGAELLSNFLGSTHFCSKRTAIGESMGAGLRRERREDRRRRL